MLLPSPAATLSASDSIVNDYELQALPNPELNRGYTGPG